MSAIEGKADIPDTPQKRSVPSRNDVLISGPEPILDGAYKLPNIESNKVRFWG
jgi:hypothetical protein